MLDLVFVNYGYFTTTSRILDFSVGILTKQDILTSKIMRSNAVNCRLIIVLLMVI